MGLHFSIFQTTLQEGICLFLDQDASLDRFLHAVMPRIIQNKNQAIAKNYTIKSQQTGIGAMMMLAG